MKDSHMIENFAALEKFKHILDVKSVCDFQGRHVFATQFLDDSDVHNKTILDIGCGYGWFELDIIRRGSIRIVGIELSIDELNIARQRICDEGVEFALANGIGLPFSDNSFDTVVAWQVLEHIPKNSEHLMFQEVRRVLKNRGVFYLSTPYASIASKFFDPAWWLASHRHYTKKQIRHFAKNRGLEIEELEIKGRFWVILGVNIMYVSKWIFRRGMIFEKIIRKLQLREFSRTRGYVHIFTKLRNRQNR
jgi:ubiquinone/menaquinone biosynthesis C-methylase UbiE